MLKDEIGIQSKAGSWRNVVRQRALLNRSQKVTPQVPLAAPFGINGDSVPTSAEGFAGFSTQPTQFPNVLPGIETPAPGKRAVVFERNRNLIEKEGFLPLLEQAQFEERYDLAVMSSKGMGTTAARALIEKLSEVVPILVLHDFDKSGFSILGTLTRDTRRYQYTSAPHVIDLGLRLEDVQNLKLAAEDVQLKSDPAFNLEENGATPEEIAFLRGKQVPWSRSYAGKRVELNALTSDQFVKWLESKMEQHGIKKIIPDGETLGKAYRHLAGILRYQEIIDRARKEVSDHTSAVKVPRSLRNQIAKRIKADRTQSWDQALTSLLLARGNETT